MKTVYLLRHAKSSWDDPSLADFDRPLSGRGRRACARMGHYAAKALRPADHVLCSAARRTRETWEQLNDALGWPVQPQFERSLYDASAHALLVRLRAVAHESHRLLLIGHNPAIQELALLLARGGDPAVRGRLAAKYPTSALAEIVFPEASWCDIAAQCGRLVRFLRPRDLEAAS